MRRHAVATVLFALAALAFVSTAAADTNITDRPYVRHDGGTDITIQSCSSDFTDPALDAPTPTPPADEGAGERQQNEPTAAVNPLDVQKMTSGANDYCPTPTTTDAWAGFYYSPDGGANWVNSLLPGYPTDTSAEGMASPLFGLVTSAGDPVQDWDRSNHLYYGGIGFNRAKPANGSIWVARYNWNPPFAAPDHEFTTIVARGTPSPIFVGHFEDKVELEADDGLNSPFEGNVYVCWARFTGSGPNNFIEFARSTDGGRTWKRQKLSASIHGNQECDIAVTRTGQVFVTWRQYEFFGTRGQQQRDAIAWVKSLDGGATFTKPAIAHEFIHWDMTDHAGNPALNSLTRYEACRGGGDFTLGACASPEPKNDARDCGDGPFVCQTGYVFGRVNSAPRNAADPVAGQGDELYVVVEATVPGTQRSTGTSYGTIVSGTASQSSIYFTKTENGGATWSPLTRIDPQPRGNQFYPDIDANAGQMHAVWQDTRVDAAVGPDGTFITAPFENIHTANPPGATATPASVVSMYATSSDGGVSWASLPASSVAYKLNWEQFGNRDIPFFGDYNYISAVGTKVLMTWTDGRDTVAGNDPRYTNGDGMDGFDVHQCRTFNATTQTWSADGCPNAGGLDQQIWGLILG
jgi:hypothetical protein